MLPLGLWLSIDRCEGLTIRLVHDPVTHQAHVVEVARDILDKFDIVVAAIVLLILERFDRNAIFVLEQCIEQRAVRIAAGVSHDVYLIRCRVDKLK